jgi:hypothetical protein
MTETLITRRDKVVNAWLNQLCPIVDPVLGADGAFSFTNAAVASRIADPPSTYQLQWFRFDNVSDVRTPTGDRQTIQATSGRAPTGLLDAGEYVGVEVSAVHPRHAGWSRPSAFFFRRASAGWTLVGVERG